MTANSARVCLRLAVHRPVAPTTSTLRASTSSTFFTPSSITTSARSFSSPARAIPSLNHGLLIPRSKFSALAANPPTATSTPSSFSTPSLCRIPSVRHASTVTTASAAAQPLSNPPSSSTALDWNSFFTLRTSRRRYSLTSSILGTLASTVSTMYLFSEHPDTADQFLKLIPTDPIVSTGIAVFASMFVGWLLGPIFGNGLWRVTHRKSLPDFSIKEKGFFERIKRHRVNPTGAGANNPVPDFYGERIGSVSGYRRWLKDQRAFNRKRAGGGSGI